jgi:pimeloyl-ACP methyl ester carboxylesterase
MPDCSNRLFHFDTVGEGFRCIAYDRRAHGRSGNPGRGYDYDALAADLAAVIDALDLQDATVVAHSFASGEIVRYLTRYGTARVRRLLFLAPAAIPFLLKTPDNPIGVEAAVFDEARRSFAQDFPAWAEANALPYFVPDTARSVIDWTLRLMTQTSLQAAVELNRIQTLPISATNFPASAFPRFSSTATVTPRHLLSSPASQRHRSFPMPASSSMKERRMVCISLIRSD